VRLRKRGKVANGPCDYVATAVEITIALVPGAEHARDIARHRRLFGKHRDGPGFRASAHFSQCNGPRNLGIGTLVARLHVAIPRSPKMSTDVALTLILIVAVLIIAILGWKLFQRQRTRRLRSQFDPEYDRTIQQYDEQAQAERDLEDRRKRMQKTNIRSLTPQERDRFADRWQTLQSRFVDDPSGTIRDADLLVVEIMLARGYPMAEFEGRADDLSVDHPLVVSHYRMAHEIAINHQRGAASTEDLRRAVVCYRELYEELLEKHLATRN
jgi:hypothetical protein